MITVRCVVCGEDIYVDIDEYLEDEEFFCPDCSQSAYIFCTEETINPN